MRAEGDKPDSLIRLADQTGILTNPPIYELRVYQFTSTRRHHGHRHPQTKAPFDYRVGLTPMGVEILTGLGHRCYVERDAGQGSGFDDERYRRAGAQIVYCPRRSTAGRR